MEKEKTKGQQMKKEREHISRHVQELVIRKPRGTDR